MEFKEEPVDCYEETVIIKQEPVCINPQNIKEEHDWATKHPEVSSTDAVPTLKQEQFEALLASSLNDIGEVEASDYFVNTNDIIVNIKREIPEFDIPVAELLTAHCDLPTIKSEHLDYYDQPCSSKQAQELPQQNKRKSAPKKVGKTKRKRKYPCPICRKSLLSNAAKKKHVTLHFKTFVMCLHCGRYFNQEKLFASHYFIHVTKGSEAGHHKCQVCSKRFTKHRDLQTHICDKKYTKIKLLENQSTVHIRRRKPFICGVCCSEFGSKWRLKRHLLYHAPNSEHPFRCEICFKTFTTRSFLEHHSKVCKNSMQCKICSKILSCSKSLNLHLRRHTGENMFECEICTKKFCTKHTLKSHIATIHSRSKTFKCDICSKILVTEEGFKNHLHNHEFVNKNQSEAKVFRCHICPKGLGTFKNPSAYQKHMDKHQTKTSVEFKCEICSIQFKLKDVYDKHLEVNSLEQPLYCNKCSEYFTLKCHILIHSKKAPAIKCIHCRQIFNCRSSLARHSLAHESAFQDANNN